MSFFFGDGFDLYAQPVDAVAGYWDAASLNPNSSTLVTGRFTGSRALNVSVSTRLVRASNQNDAVHHFTFAFMTTNNSGSSPGFFMTLFDGANAQCSVVLQNDGTILLTSGGPTGGTTLKAYVGPAYVNNVWYAFEIEVVLHATNGAMRIKKNGNPNYDYDSGIIGNSSSGYANKLQIGAQSNSVHVIDDFLWRSEPSTVPWSGDIRCYTRHPASDVSVPTPWSRTSAPVNALMWNPVNVQQNGSQSATYLQFTAPYSGLLTGVTFGPNSNGGTGHIKAAVFSNIGGLVGSVLAVATEVTNPSPGITLSFPTPAYLVGGQTYWVGVITDTSTIQINVVNNPAGCTGIIYSNAVPYASWPVSNPGAPLTSGNVPGLTLIFTPQSNADAVAELYQDLTTNYVYSSVNGQNDLYTIGSIPVTPAQILGVVTRGFFEKSDAGTRNATVQLKSGGTTVQGPDTALLTGTWNWISRTDLTDPATGAAWTVSAANAVQIGPRCTA